MSRGYNISQPKLLLLLFLALIGLFFISLSIGSSPISLFKVANEAIADNPSVISLILTELKITI